MLSYTNAIPFVIELTRVEKQTQQKLILKGRHREEKCMEGDGYITFSTPADGIKMMCAERARTMIYQNERCLIVIHEGLCKCKENTVPSEQRTRSGQTGQGS